MGHGPREVPLVGTGITGVPCRELKRIMQLRGNPSVCTGTLPLPCQGMPLIPHDSHLQGPPLPTPSWVGYCQESTLSAVLQE